MAKNNNNSSLGVTCVEAEINFRGGAIYDDLLPVVNAISFACHDDDNVYSYLIFVPSLLRCCCSFGFCLSLGRSFVICVGTGFLDFVGTKPLKQRKKKRKIGKYSKYCHRSVLHI